MKIWESIGLKDMDEAIKKGPLTGLKLYILLFSLGMSSFIDMLDFSIANVAVPSIAALFGTSTSQGTWVITLYAVTSCVSLALTGRLALRLGSAWLALRD
jgi:DHA2 family multidrug resistance protein